MPFTLEQLNQGLQNIEVTEDEHNYLFSYQELLEHFITFHPITIRNFIVGSHIVYGWMPTMLTLHATENVYANIVNILNNLEQGHCIDVDNLALLKSIINHSLVGASKYLHCLYPDCYAIWDSRVYSFIHGEINWDQINNPINYLAYLQNCREVIDEQAFQHYHQQVNQIIGHNVSQMRAIEWVMYMNGGN